MIKDKKLKWVVLCAKKLYLLCQIFQIIRICAICNLYFYNIITRMKPVQSINLITEQSTLLKKIYSQGENLWKVLIFDAYNREINSSLFKLKDLRDNNITLYFHLKQKRQQLHGVTAIYLVEPTLENIQLITVDFEEELYSSVIIHFSSEPPTHLLSKFANTLGKMRVNALTKINKVQYSFLGFHTISKNLAVAQNNNELINLISVMKNKPIFIYGPKDQQQVSFLKGRLSNNIIFEKEEQLSSIRQPQNIVLFFNRQLDYFPVLHHSITYSGLIQSLYKLSPNGHQIQKSISIQKIQLNDEIWVERRNLPVSEMQLQEDFNRIKVKLMGEKDKIDGLNDLTQKSKRIESHIHTAQQVIRQASERKLNQYYQLEMEIYRKRVLSSQIKKDIDSLLEMTTNDSDKIRLIIIVLMYCQHIDIKEIDYFQSKVPKLKQSKLYNQLKSKLNSGSQGGSMGMIGGKMIKKFTLGILGNFKSGDKFLLTKYIQKVRDLRQNDIKELGLSISSLGSIPPDFKIGSILVYCVGGGCLSEQANVSKFQSKVIYTCDKMLNALDVI